MCHCGVCGCASPHKATCNNRGGFPLHEGWWLMKWDAVICTKPSSVLSSPRLLSSVAALLHRGRGGRRIKSREQVVRQLHRSDSCMSGRGEEDNIDLKGEGWYWKRLWRKVFFFNLYISQEVRLTVRYPAQEVEEWVRGRLSPQGEISPKVSTAVCDIYCSLCLHAASLTEWKYTQLTDMQRITSEIGRP